MVLRLTVSSSLAISPRRTGSAAWTAEVLPEDMPDMPLMEPLPEDMPDIPLMEPLPEAALIMLLMALMQMGRSPGP